MKISREVCNQLESILEVKPSPNFRIPYFCRFTNLRSFPVTCLKKATTDASNNIFGFSSTNLPGKTLNTGWFSLLQSEVTLVVNQLVDQGITVTSISDFSLFSSPRIIQVYYQVIEDPIHTAKKLKRVLSKLKNVVKSLPEFVPSPAFKRLCHAFAQAAGMPDDMGNIGKSCELNRLRDLKVTINGQRPIGDLRINLSFESLDQNAKALCIGEVPLLQHEVSPFLKAIHRAGGMIDSSLSTRFFCSPQVYFLTYISIQNPITFAQKSKSILSLLA